jgi:hypothetical protein
MSLNPEMRQRILSNIKKRVLANHINVAGVDYEDWFQSIDKQRTDLLASGEEDFEDRVRRIFTGAQEQSYCLLPRTTFAIRTATHNKCNAQQC